MEEGAPFASPWPVTAGLGALQLHAAALEVDDGKAGARPGDAVGLAVLAPDTEPLAAKHDGVVGELGPQHLDELLLRRRFEDGLGREDLRGLLHRTCVSIRGSRPLRI